MYLKINFASKKDLPYKKYFVNFDGNTFLVSMDISDQTIDFIYAYPSNEVDDNLNKFLIGQVSRISKYLINVFDFTEVQNMTTTFFIKQEDVWVEHKLELNSEITYIDYYRNLQNEDRLKNFANYLSGQFEIPESLVILKNTKKISDIRTKYIMILVALEIGIKEFYTQLHPELNSLFEKIPSPPVTELLGTIFKEINNKEFPKELRTKIGPIIKKRNKLVHSINKSSSNTPSISDTFDAFNIVLRSLNFLNSYAFPTFFDSNYNKTLSLTDAGKNTKKINSQGFIDQDLVGCSFGLTNQYKIK